MKFAVSILLIISILFSVSFINAAKNKFINSGLDSTPIKFEIPKGWPKPKNDIFKNNPLTEEGFQLGRKLFYDGRLSKDGLFACNTCHQQFSAFSNFDHDFSHGFNNSLTARNAPALINLAWMDKYQWDGSANHLEVQALSPMTSSTEMGESLDSVLLKLQADSIYKKMFYAAFGSEEINSQKMLKALAQFTGSLVSSNSKYDKVKIGSVSFTPMEQRGYEIYKQNCSTCHPEPLFTDNSFRNNGLLLSPYSHDFGRMTITGNPKDSLKFKVPTLRNAGITFPYMHDGRLYTLDKVIDHYVCEIQNSATLDPVLKKPIEIDETGKKDLIAFIYTLTDTSFTRNRRFSRFK